MICMAAYYAMEAARSATTLRSSAATISVEAYETVGCGGGGRRRVVRNGRRRRRPRARQRVCKGQQPPGGKCDAGPGRRMDGGVCPLGNGGSADGAFGGKPAFHTDTSSVEASRPGTVRDIHS